MELVFQRTSERRYSILALRPDLPSALMDPAPGYDPFLPHDVMHMVVEAELGLESGVFGQLASGGLAGSFRVLAEKGVSTREASRQKRRAANRDKSLLKDGVKDCAFSERATYLCWHEWLSRSDDIARRNLARSMTENAEHVRGTAPAEELRIMNASIDRVCRRLDELSKYWLTLAVGEKMVVSWPQLTVSRSR